MTQQIATGTWGFQTTLFGAQNTRGHTARRFQTVLMNDQQGVTDGQPINKEGYTTADQTSGLSAELTAAHLQWLCSKVMGVHWNPTKGTQQAPSQLPTPLPPSHHHRLPNSAFVGTELHRIRMCTGALSGHANSVLKTCHLSTTKAEAIGERHLCGAQTR